MGDREFRWWLTCVAACGALWLLVGLLGVVNLILARG